MPIDTDKWPFVQAKWFTKVMPAAPRTVRLIVIHDMEAPEKGDTAENVARYFATLNERNADGSPKKASAHVCIDSNSVVQCVYDRDVAYAAPGANSDGIQIELAGYGSQTRGQWLDPYSVAMLAVAANVVAQYCLKLNIPARQLTNAQLGTKAARGIIGHAQASQVFRLSSHTDPGKGFPWDLFIPQVALQLQARRQRFGV